MSEIINNVELIRGLLVLPEIQENDNFYIVQLIKRRKDVPDLGKSEIHLGAYYISSFKDYDRIIPDLVRRCNAESCRLYISLHPRSKKRTLLQMTLECSMALKENIDRKISRPWSIALKAATQKYTRVTKEALGRARCILDIDTFKDLEMLKEAVSEKTKIWAVIPTYSGIHLWTDAFNPADLKTIKSEVTYVNEATTILYASRESLTNDDE